MKEALDAMDKERQQLRKDLERQHVLIAQQVDRTFSFVKVALNQNFSRYGNNMHAIMRE